MQEWFIPQGWTAETTTDVRVGGKYRHEMIPSEKDQNSEKASCAKKEAGDRGFVHFGEYVEVRRPEKLVFTWNSHLAKETLVTIDFHDRGDSTELVLTHELLESADVRQKHKEGWESLLGNLGGYVN